MARPRREPGLSGADGIFTNYYLTGKQLPRGPKSGFRRHAQVAHVTHGHGHGHGSKENRMNVEKYVAEVGPSTPPTPET
jgi:hypothetical protein